MIAPQSVVSPFVSVLLLLIARLSRPLPRTLWTPSPARKVVCNIEVVDGLAVGIFFPVTTLLKFMLTNLVLFLMLTRASAL